MMWQDLVIDRVIPDSELAATIATTFGTAASRVYVTDEITTETPSEDVDLIVERGCIGGEFPMRVSLYLLALESSTDAPAFHNQVDILAWCFSGNLVRHVHP